MAIINLENWVFTERKLPVQNASIVVRRSDSGASVGTATSDVNGHWGPVAVDTAGWPAGVYPDVEVTYGSQVRVDKGGAQYFVRSVAVGGTWDFSGTTVTLPSGQALVDPKIDTFFPYYSTGTYTLPTVTGNAGKVRVTKAWGGTLQVNCTGAEVLIAPGSGGAVSPGFLLQTGESVVWMCDGTNWWGTADAGGSTWLQGAPGQTYTLPTAASNGGKWRYYKAWGGSITIQRSGADNLIGPGATGIVTTFTVPNGTAVMLYCDGTSWWVAGASAPATRLVQSGTTGGNTVNGGANLDVTVTFGTAYSSAPTVVATLGGDVLCRVLVQSTSTTQAVLRIKNESGSQQSTAISWIAEGAA